MAHSKVAPSAADHKNLPAAEPPATSPTLDDQDQVQEAIPLQESPRLANGGADQETKPAERNLARTDSQQSQQPKRKASDNRKRSSTAEVGSPGKRISSSHKPAAAESWPEIVRAAIKTNEPTRRATFFASVNLFAVCVGFLFLLHGMQIQYNNQATPHFARRYPIDVNEVEFIHGVEVMAVLICLLLVAYFGNRFHRPLAMAAGAFLSAAGLLTKAAAYFTYGTIEYDETILSPFLESELCPSNLRNLTVNNPCEALQALNQPFLLPFSTACFGQFLVGIGVSLYASLGIVHIEENTKPNRATILIGVCLSMHGLGQFVGTFLGGLLMALPEDLNGPRYAVSEVERVGAWWLGYLIISGGLVLLTACFSCFPIWFSEPEWLTSRKERLKKKLLEGRIKRRISNKQSRAATTSGQYQKNTRKTSSAAKPSDKKDGSKKKTKERSGNAAEKGDKDKEQSDDKAKRKVSVTRKTSGATKLKRRSTGSMRKKSPPGRKVSADVARQVAPKVASTSDETSAANEAPRDGADNPAFELEPPLPTDTPTSSSAEKTVANPDEIYEEIDDKPAVNGEAHKKSPNKDKNAKESQKKKSSRTNNGKSKRSHSNGKVASKKVISRKTSILLQKHLEKELADIENSKTYRRKKRYIRRREHLKDLPRHMWRIMRNVPMAATVTGAILSSYLLFGYLTYLPSYTKIVFHRDETTAGYVTAGIGPLPWAIGLLAGAYFIRRREMELHRACRIAVVTSVLSAVLALVLMACDCTVPESRALYNETNPLLWDCNKACDCKGVQLDPICGFDGVTFPSPCHAGCKTIDTGAYVGEYDYTSCECVGDGSGLQEATYGYCTSNCATYYIYCLIVFIMALIYGFGQMPVILVFLRATIRDRYKSLSIGFSLWLIYALGIMLSPVVYSWILDTQCKARRTDCHEIDTCWEYHRNNVRYVYHGATSLFLLAAAACYTLAVHRLSPAGTRHTQDVEKGDDEVTPVEQVAAQQIISETADNPERVYIEPVKATSTEDVQVDVKL